MPLPPQDEASWQEYVLQEAVSVALEAERRRLARQLEEQLISQINLVLAQVSLYEQNASASARTTLGVLSSLVRQLLQQAHDLAGELKPSTLETLGLFPALEELANHIRRSQGVNLILDLPYQGQRLPVQVELTLFRLSQDLTQRLISTGAATRLKIRLEFEPEETCYRLFTNGELPEGLATMVQQRVEWLGGRCDLQHSSPGDNVLSIVLHREAAAQLTTREMEVIRLLAEGLSNAEIAARLDIRPRTAKFHLDNIFSKLQVNSRTAAAIYALRQGWVQRHPPA